GDQHGNHGGGADELRGALVAKDGVIPVVTAGDQILAGFVFGEKAEAVAEVPAAGTLAEIATDGGGVADLRAGSFVEGIRQSGKVLDDGSVVGEIGEGGERADAKTVRGGSNTLQLSNVLQIHQAFGMGNVILH